ncbi:hypothetical protein [Roseococcus pinisoli]|uniref:Phage head morphogenesis domain-containing protein n=1 Tax=Roseococcus pinisoli TaxID=2835040 RepID=A0ABS5QF89_9PROT|nr:hypothetical protein [Roseococcus pinisoli]MBS7812359.1 hypothetical protein [Roseococcus pinisoli]
MRPKLQTYVAVETSFAAAIGAAVQPDLQAVADEAASHAHPENALGVLDKWAPPVFSQETRAKLGELAVSAILFGASRMGPIQESRYMQALPHLQIKTAIHQAEMMATRSMRKLLVKQVTSFAIAYRAGAPLPEGTPGLIKGDLCCSPKGLLKADDPYADMADAMNAVVMGTGRAMKDIAANLTTSRLVAFGALGEAEARNQTHYQIDSTLDDRICPICAHMNGRRFPVRDTLGKVERLLLLDDPEDLKSAAPFPRQNKAGIAEFESLENQELIARGWNLPPWHPGCRCLIVADGDAKAAPPAVPPAGNNDGLQSFTVHDSEAESFWSKLAEILKKNPPAP